MPKPPPAPPARRSVWLYLAPARDEAARQRELLKQELQRMGRLRPVTYSILELSYDPHRTTGKEIRARLQPYAPLLQWLHWQPETGLAPRPAAGRQDDGDAAPGGPPPILSWRSYLQSAYAVCGRFVPASRGASHQWQRYLHDDD